MNVNHLFGLTKYIDSKYKKKIKKGCVLDAFGNHIQTGTPCFIFDSNSDSNENKIPLNKGNKNLTLFPFHTYKNMKPRKLFSIGSTNIIIKELGPTNFFNNIKTIKKSKLNTTEFKHEITYVNKTGPVVFLIDNSKDIINDIKQLIKELYSDYGIVTITDTNIVGNLTSTDNEKVVLAISMVKLEDCTPIFNHAKVNGITLRIAVVYTEKSKKVDTLTTSYECGIIFSKFKENITEIDGMKLNTRLVKIQELLELVDAGTAMFNTVGIIKTKSDKQKKLNSNSISAINNGNSTITTTYNNIEAKTIQKYTWATNIDTDVKWVTSS